MSPTTGQLLIIFLILLWTLPWKGWALWKAARAGNKIWFIILLVVNSLAILEILYIFLFSQKKISTPVNQEELK